MLQNRREVGEGFAVDVIHHQVVDTYLVAREAMKQLQRAGVQFIILSRDSNAPSLEEVASGERI